MKNSAKLLSVVLAAGTAGVAVFAAVNSAFVASLPGDVLLGVGASLGLLGFAASDSSRRSLPLSLPGRLLRPALPAAGLAARECRKDRAAA
jgi:hypothetical protein